MTATGGRLGLTARAFFLSTVLGLALAFQEPKVIQGLLFLVAIGSLAMAATTMTVVAERWICVLEGVLTAFVIGLSLPEGSLLLPYLVVPALLGGAAAGVVAAVLVSGAEMLGFFAVLALGGHTVQISNGVELAAPWAFASLGAGLTGAWVVQLRGGALRSDEASYESARRLLSQLRIVARRLSSGLDPVSMAAQALITVHEALDDSRSAVFVRTEGGVLSPLGYRGPDARDGIAPDGHLVKRCWDEAEPVCEPQASGISSRRYRTVLPLRSGARMIGVVVAEAGQPANARTLQDLMVALDEQSLRLDTALVFDEVRSLATLEERQRLAREIHDGVAQEIAGLGYFIDDLSATSVNEAQRAKLQTLRSEISRVVSELRLSIFDLRAEISPAAGLGSALSDYIRAVGARSGMTVHLTLDESPTRLRSEVETELLRIAQEAVTNARKHSGATNLWVDCRVRPPQALIRVEDDGTGLGEARADSYGMKIMRERAERIGACLEIEARDGEPKGTKVTVALGHEVERLGGGKDER